MRPKTSLCFIVWNEKLGCERDLPQFDLNEFDEVFAIDGGSTDGTVEVLRQHGVVVRPQIRLSLNAAYWQAVEASACENIVVFFPKGTLDPSIAKEMKLLLLAGNEMVVASRLIKGARNEEDDSLFRPRKWGIRILAMFAALCWCRRRPVIHDVLHGVKGFTKRAFLDMNPSQAGVTIDLEMAVRAYRLRLPVCELPVVETTRSWGDSRFKILPTGIRLGRFLWSELCGPRWSPSARVRSAPTCESTVVSRE
jgi:glycosyltransferase involved in cell wall biosynthesis